MQLTDLQTAQDSQYAPSIGVRKQFASNSKAFDKFILEVETLSILRKH